MNAEATDGFNPAKIDRGILPYVEALRAGGVETFESCEGGEGHCFAEPTIRFYGGRPEGLRALAVAQQNDLPVAALRRSWQVVEGEPTGPHWELSFLRADPGGS
jgi:hypothetical protein